ncbi:MAG: hypothetical protein D3926_18400 [Desulfobacteraceae bacterium]|nr:MAG: hypothetical protein D3926_18400 [Desulfobacteraceae bacterium]
MKKYLYPIIILSLVGGVISALLLFRHYYPESGIKIVSCGHSLVDPCIALSATPYAVLFGVPIALFGLLWYLTTIFTVLITLHSGGRYPALSMIMIFPGATTALAADVVLAGILINTGLLCPLCIVTYVINTVIFILACFALRQLKRDDKFSLGSVARNLFSKDLAPDKKAFKAAYVSFLMVMCVALMSVSYGMHLDAENGGYSESEISAFVEEFKQMPDEQVEFPETGLVLGNPDAAVSVVVFSDFLCSACREFFMVEKHLLSILGRYKDRVKFVYFNFPLDAACNSDVEESIYENSCIASKAMIAASEMGILEPYIVRHFSYYDDMNGMYEPSDSMSILRQVATGKGSRAEKDFDNLMMSDTVRERIDAHVRLAVELGIEATPTVFIAGRRLEGVPPVELLERIILEEVNKEGA